MPHMQMRKVAYFLRVWPGGELACNEYDVKWPMTVAGRQTTYNPDYFYPGTGEYIEVATSTGNIGEQGAKWRQAIADGRPLRVYWWDGTDITEIIASNGKLPASARRDRCEDLPEP